MLLFSPKIHLSPCFSKINSSFWAVQNFCFAKPLSTASPLCFNWSAIIIICDWFFCMHCIRATCLKRPPEVFVGRSEYSCFKGRQGLYKCVALLRVELTLKRFETKMTHSSSSRSTSYFGKQYLLFINFLNNTNHHYSNNNICFCSRVLLEYISYGKENVACSSGLCAVLQQW